jgi:hypothetical protein
MTLKLGFFFLQQLSTGSACQHLQIPESAHSIRLPVMFEIRTHLRALSGPDNGQSQSGTKQRINSWRSWSSENLLVLTQLQKQHNITNTISSRRPNPLCRLLISILRTNGWLLLIAHMSERLFLLFLRDLNVVYWDTLSGSVLENLSSMPSTMSVRIPTPPDNIFRFNTIKTPQTNPWHNPWQNPLMHKRLQLVSEHECASCDRVGSDRHMAA